MARHSLPPFRVWIRRARHVQYRALGHQSCPPPTNRSIWEHSIVARPPHIPPHSCYYGTIIRQQGSSGGRGGPALAAAALARPGRRRYFLWERGPWILLDDVQGAVSAPPPEGQGWRWMRRDRLEGVSFVELLDKGVGVRHWGGGQVTKSQPFPGWGNWIVPPPPPPLQLDRSRAQITPPTRVWCLPCLGSLTVGGLGIEIDGPSSSLGLWASDAARRMQRWGGGVLTVPAPHVVGTG